MYCSECGSSIDYRFSTTCLNCSHDFVKARAASQSLTQDAFKGSSRLKVRHHLANLTLILVATVVGWFAGAVVIFFGGWAVVLLLDKLNIIGEISCGGGSFLGIAFLIGGANVGSVSGGLFGFAHRFYRTA